MFHPLNLENNGAQSFARDIEMLQRSRRVRPEDIDLPIFSTVSQDSNIAAVDGIKQEVGESNQAEQTKESDKLLKRKKFLSAQLNFTKKLGVPPKKPSSDQKEEESSSSKPVSTQELIEAVIFECFFPKNKYFCIWKCLFQVKKSIGTKKAELKAQVVEKVGIIFDCVLHKVFYTGYKNAWN